MEIFRIECGEAFVEDRQVSPLQQGAGDVEAAFFAVAELPTGFPHDLEHASGHAIQQGSQAQTRQVCSASSTSDGTGGQLSAHECVEGESPHQHVVVVKLRRDNHTSPPALRPNDIPVEAVEQEQAGLRHAAAGEQGGER